MLVGVQEAGKARYEVDVPNDSTVKDLVEKITATGLGVVDAGSTVEFPEGKEIAVGARLSELGIANGSTVFLKTSAAAESIPTGDLANTIIVTNIPLAEKNVTENAVFEFVSAFGEIKRLVLEEDDNNTTQHAVIVFTNAEAVAVSLRHTGATILKGTITIIAASSSPSQPAYGKTTDKVVKSVAKVLAGGISSAKGFDEQHKISASVKNAADVAKNKVKELDSQLKVSEKFAEVDGKYHVSEKAAKATQYAIGTASLAAKTAMANPVVSIGVKKLGSVFSSVVSMASGAVGEVKTQIKVEDEKRLNSPSRRNSDAPSFADAPSTIPSPAPEAVAAVPVVPAAPTAPSVAPPAPSGNYKDI
ncbi:unnamed protein product [Aphanomyces euteiches]|nr:hypothetical protein Ae201684P_011069 [Aphanomyces euteiches]KAH9135666.1 hypothetical protein AeRB84_018970 [Aphanomyces euteiches]